MTRTSKKSIREIKVAHSPDSDDAFMFYGMATNKIRLPGVKFTHTLCDIETLNRKALESFYDITAISFHAYPYIQDNYALMPSGGSVGDGYGPMIVALRNIPQDEIARCRVAVPGTMTTAYLVLKLFAPEITTEVVPFDEIIPRVLEGKYEAGLIIHEGQLTFNKSGLQKILDLGRWWREQTGLHCRSAATRFAAILGRSWWFPAAPPCATAFFMRSSIARRRCSMPCSSPATWTRKWPTSLWACM